MKALKVGLYLAIITLFGASGIAMLDSYPVGASICLIISFTMIAVGAIYAWYIHPRQQRKKQSVLGEYADDGQSLMTQCANEKDPPPNDAAEAWAKKVETYLSANLGKSYITRFRSGHGLPMSANSISSMDHRNLWAGLRVRIIRLHEFIKEINP